MISNSGCALQYIPENIITEEIVEIAVSNSCYALNYVPKELINNNLILIYISKSIHRFLYFNKIYRHEIKKLNYEKAMEYLKLRIGNEQNYLNDINFKDLIINYQY